MTEWNHGCTTDVITINEPGWYTIGWSITLHLDSFVNLPRNEIANVLVNGQVCITKMISASEFFEDEHGTHARYIYETTGYVEHGDKVHGDLRFQFDGDYTHTNEIRATSNSPAEDTLVLCDEDQPEPMKIITGDGLCGGGELTIQPAELTLTFAEIDTSNNLTLFGTDEDGNQCETLTINCLTGEVTFRNENPNIEEEAKEFWQAVERAFPFAFVSSEFGAYRNTTVTEEEQHSTAYDRAMGVLTDNG